MALGASMMLSNPTAPRQPNAAPERSTKYTRPMGKGILVRAMHTATPEKKKGTAITPENSKKLNTVCRASEMSKGIDSMISKHSGIEMATANTDWYSRRGSNSTAKKSGRS